MDGYRHSVTSADGTRIGLLTAGEGPPLLLVHGGMGRIESWQPLWGMLTGRWRVTAMDRRGRGTSGDTEPYDLSREGQDIAAVAASLAADGPVDVFGHSFGATCTLAAAASGAPVRRLALYEPPGPQTVPREWRDRINAMIAAGKPGPAMVSFLAEPMGLTAARIDELRNAPRGYDVLPVVSATMPREARGPGRHVDRGRPGRGDPGPGLADPRRAEPGLGTRHHRHPGRGVAAEHPGRPGRPGSRGHRKQRPACW